MRYHDADCLATAVSGAGARSEQPSATPRVGPPNRRALDLGPISAAYFRGIFGESIFSQGSIDRRRTNKQRRGIRLKPSEKLFRPTVTESLRLQSLACFVCGRSYYPVSSKGDDSTRFCCRVCRQAYDRGYQPNPQADVFAVHIRDWKILAGPPGVQIGASYYVPILDKPRKKRSAKRLENDELIRPRTLCVKCGAKTEFGSTEKR